MAAHNREQHWAEKGEAAINAEMERRVRAYQARKAALTAVLLLWASVASAQTFAATSGYAIQARLHGATVGAELVTPLSEWTCDLEPSPLLTGVVVNPQTLSLDDPHRPGRTCHLDIVAWRAGLPPAEGYVVYVASLAADGARAAYVEGTPAFTVESTVGPPVAPTDGRLWSRVLNWLAGTVAAYIGMTP